MLCVSVLPLEEKDVKMHITDKHMHQRPECLEQVETDVDKHAAKRKR
jgi:hypothetical protein